MDLGKTTEEDKDQVKTNQGEVSANPAEGTDPEIPVSLESVTKEPVAETADSENIGVGQPDIGVEKPPAKPETPEPATPAEPLPINNPAPPAPETPTPVPAPAPEPEPAKDGSMDIPINKYSNNVSVENTPEPAKPAEATANAPATPVSPSSFTPPVAPTHPPTPPVKAPARVGAIVASLALVALVVGSAGGFFGFKYLDKIKSSADTLTTPTPSTSTSASTTAKTYSSTKYGFSFSYPSNWFISSTDTEATSIIVASNQESLEGTPTGYKVSFDFVSNDGKTLKAWLDSYQVTAGETGTPTETTISGNPAYQLTLAKTANSTATYIPLTDKIMIVTYTATADKLTTGQTFYTQILESIKVTS